MAKPYLREDHFIGGRSLEDSLLNQNVIRNQLKNLGVKSVLAVDGRKGLTALEEGDFELVLCDCSMPEMDGYQFTEAVRKREASEAKGCHIPIIALTANAFREDVERCFASGMDDFISKPASIERLASKLRKWRGSVERRTLSGKSDSAPINISLLAEILNAGDWSKVKSELERFLVSARKSIEHINDALMTKDAAKVTTLVQASWREALSATASELARLYEKLETEVSDGNLEGVKEVTIEAAAMIDQIEDFIEQPHQLDTRTLADKIMPHVLSTKNVTESKSAPLPENDSINSTVAVDVLLLGELLGNHDPRHLKKTLEILWETVEQTPKQLREFASDRNDAALLKVAHAARGAFASGAARVLEDLLKKLENAARESDWDSIPAILLSIDEAFADFHEFVELYEGEAGEEFRILPNGDDG